MSALDRLFAFSGLAVIGGTSRNSYATQVLGGLTSVGYRGNVACVNPQGERVGDVPGFRSLAEIPFALDAADIVVRAERVPELLEQCGTAGIRSVTIVSSGFAESGADGRVLQEQLVEIAQRHGIAVCGPNCLGFVSLHDRTSTYSRSKLPADPGGVAVVAHSGGMLNEILSYGSYRGIRFSKAVSSGNEAVVALPDYLDHLLDDPNTTTIGLVIEGIREPSRLRSAFARATRRRKPIVAIKIGSSVLARESAATHTGAMVGSADLFSALAEQYAVTVVEDIDEFCETLLAFSQTRHLIASGMPPRGMAAIEISGGGKGLICDLADRYGLPLPPLQPATAERLQRALGPESAPSNPIDLVLSWEVPKSLELHAAALESLAADGAYDTIVSRVSVFPSGSIEPALAHGRLIERLQREHPDTFFAVLGRASDVINPLWRAFCDEHDILYAQGYKRGIAALGNVRRYRVAAPNIDDVIAATMPLAPERAAAMLDEAESKERLAELGFSVNKTVFAVTEDDAVAVARTIGYPVVVKGLSPNAVHKSDGGFVALNLTDEAAVRYRTRDMLARLHELGSSNGARVGVTVQKQVPTGLEIIVGGYRDSLYGPVVMCALGGVFAEAFEERLLWLAPVSASAILRRIVGSTIGRLGRGFRTLGASDIEPLAETVARISVWFAADPQIGEFDINPLILRGSEQTIVDARIQLIS